MRKLWVIFLMGAGLTVAAQTVSYWFYGFQHQPSATLARQYLFAATNSPSPGDTIRWDGTNFHWGP